MDSKKAQMEIIGLVVIVILISLGMLFLVQFALKEKPDGESFTRKGLAFSTMSTLMKTTVECQSERKNLSMRELLAECAENRPGAGFPFTRTCNRADSCVAFEERSQNLLQQTLGSWGKQYEFTARRSQGIQEETVLSFQENACAGRERDTSGSFAHPTDAGTIRSILYVCG